MGNRFEARGGDNCQLCHGATTYDFNFLNLEIHKRRFFREKKTNDNLIPAIITRY